MTRRQSALNLTAKAAAFLLACIHPGWAVLLFISPDLYLLYHLFVPSAQGLVQVFTRFETPRREVWLTIDDGPDPIDTPRILDLLERFGARATFFVIGARAERFPDLMAEIARRGHDVGNHSYSHPAGSFWCLPPAALARELDRGPAPLAAAGGRSRWFRPPVGIKNLFLRRALRERDLSCVGWSARGWDSASRHPERVTGRIVRAARPGAILLVHEGAGVPAAVRVEAIGQILRELTAQGYRFVVPDAAQLI
jgi:peptidoglycan/xylan/chitin deacetylase (PgdA/CDA1 family)